MSLENVQFVYPNFCISPRADEFCSINYVAGTMVANTSLGAVQKTYSLDTAVDEIQSLEYTGPRNLSLSYLQLGTNLPFFSLEHTSSSGCKIRRWQTNNTSSNLVLQNTITLTSSGTYSFNCYDMSIEHYETTFSSSTTSGTGKIALTSIGNIEIDDWLLLGPSSDADNMFATEWVQVTLVSGSWAYITASGVTPPVYEYVNGNPICYYKHAYIFSDTGQSGNTAVGSLYKIDLNDGLVLEVNDSGVYSGVRASAWSRDYNNVGFVKDSNILYIDPYNDYEVQKSQVMNNIESDHATLIPVYDLVFNSAGIYRLQLKTTRADDAGAKTTTTWATYNYQIDSISPYSCSISLVTDPAGIVVNDAQITINAIVRDQFGVGLLSKTLYFYDVPDDGEFEPLSGEAVTDSNGQASIDYDVDYFDPTGALPDAESIVISAKVAGALVGVNGSQYVWDNMDLLLKKRLRAALYDLIQMPTWSGGIPGPGSDLYCATYLTQIEGMDSSFYVSQLKKFQFPGGEWTGSTPPVDPTTIIKQVLGITRTGGVNQISNQLQRILGTLIQAPNQTNTLQVDQMYVSRHTLTEHQDTATIEQFQFIVDTIPVMWSEKNPVDTDIWVRLGPPSGFSLNKNTLVFKVKEYSYVGDTGFVDVTSSCVVTTFDAGGGLLGVEITYDPAVDFHYNAIVYVLIVIYDVAPSPNIITTNYWFKVIPDYKGPYIENEDPAREEEDVAVNTNISFDIYDIGEGVDPATVEMYVNNRVVLPVISIISGGYHVECDPIDDFNYGEIIEVTVRASDISDYTNVLYDMWRFYCVGSTGPWIDPNSFIPEVCERGVFRKTTDVSFNVYGVDGTGVDNASILVSIGGKDRTVTVIPIIYRVD